MKWTIYLFALVAVGCSPPPGSTSGAAPSTLPANTGGPASGAFTVTSSTFHNGGVIPSGGQVPDLHWSNLPKGTANITIEVIDPDAGNFVHWIVTNIDPNGTPQSGVSGKNGSGDHGYYPPEPPPGETHHYHFKVFALDQQLQFDQNYEIADLDNYMRGHILGQTEIVATYKAL